MKMKKRMLSIALALLVLLIPSSVFAKEERGPKPTLQEAVVSVKATAVSNSFKEKARDRGIRITDDTLISVAPVNTTSKEKSGNAVIISNAENDIVTNDILLPIGEDGKIGIDNLQVLSDSYVYDPADQLFGGKILIHGTAVYYGYSHNLMYAWFRPIEAYFTYEKKKTCSVTKMAMDFITSGTEYSYPGFENLHTVKDYVIPVSASNPSPNLQYVRAAPYSSQKAICISGSERPGLWLAFTATCDGTTYRGNNIQLR